MTTAWQPWTCGSWARQRNVAVLEARDLGESRGAALLNMEHEALDGHGWVAQFAGPLCAASPYRFEINLIRLRPALQLRGARPPVSCSVSSARSSASSGWPAAPSRVGLALVCQDGGDGAADEPRRTRDCDRRHVSRSP